MNGYRLKILTPEKVIFEGMATSMMVTSEDGGMTVLRGHAPMVALLAEGPIIVRTEDETLEGMAGQGLLQISYGETAVMVHSFSWADKGAAGEESGDSPGLEASGVPEKP